MADMDGLASDLERRIATRFRVDAAPLAVMQRRLRRRMPHRIWRDLEMLAQAEEMAHHPRLVSRIDMQGAARAAARVGRWIDRQDPARARADRRRGLVFRLAVNGLLVTGLLLAVLALRGHLGAGNSAPPPVPVPLPTGN